MYLSFYEQQWAELMESDHRANAPLQDYPDRSVWTTWAISYQAIRDKHEATANLLLLWSFLDNKDLWHGLLVTACRSSSVAARMLSKWIGDIASSKIRFSGAMQLLRNYSLVEEAAETGSYTTHPVVHQWAYHSQSRRFATELSRLSAVTVGCTVPDDYSRDYATLQRRLLPHAQACSRRIVKKKVGWDHRFNEGNDKDVTEDEEQQAVLDAVHFLGSLYMDQGKLDEAEQMYERALRGKEDIHRPTHISILSTVNNLGILYRKQGKLDKAEQMYERALRGYEEALSSARVMQYMPVLNTLQNMGDLYATRAETAKAQAIYARALSGLCDVLGQSSQRYMDLAAKIDALPVPIRETEGQSEL